MDKNERHVPIITVKPGGSDKAARLAFRSVCMSMLGIDACAQAAAEFLNYKPNDGSPIGHKVGDLLAALDATIKAAPEALQQSAHDNPLKLWPKAQVLLGVIRRDYELDKQWKMTGQLSKRKLLEDQRWREQQRKEEQQQ